MNIIEIYEKYKIPPNLREHMLRVTAIGLFIADHFNDKNLLNREVIKQTLLLHDMGNIIKFDFKTTKAIDPGLEKNNQYWLSIQKEFTEKYTDEITANYEIAKQIGVSAYILSLIAGHEVSHLNEILNASDMNLKIISYSDYRINPFGVVTLEERFEDLFNRYKDRSKNLAEKLKERMKLFKKIEEQIQIHENITLSQITNEMIKPTLKELPSTALKFT